ncbi:MAG TPA: NMD3-related protein [Candidatus Nanoarchaeia archaeon]|nr:NMD3-related protein [Candidatus Nanoarchaeia archaeon]
MNERPSTYFEGILQLRSNTPQLLAWVHKRIKQDGKARVAKEKKITGGVDLYLSDQHYLQSLGRKINHEFVGLIKVSRRLHTVNKMTSKLLYRVTVLFQQLHWKRGQKVMIDGEEFEIMNIADRVQIKNVKSGERSLIDADRLLRNQ